MKKLTDKVFLTSILLLVYSVSYQAIEQPYAELTDRSVKALSATEIKGLLTGQGMGMALAAELNAYPGPKHVLELANQLKLSEQQRQQTERLYSAMLLEAKQLGKKIVEQERALDVKFKSRKINQQHLKRLLGEIATLKSELRFVHLNTHLKLTSVLTEQQQHQYQQLRGYHSKKQQHKHHH